MIIGSRSQADVVAAARYMRIAAWGFAHGRPDEQHLRATIVDEELPDGMGLFDRTITGYRFRLPGEHELAHDQDDPTRSGRDYLALVTIHIDRIRITLLPEWDFASGCEVSQPMREDRSDVGSIETNIDLSRYVEAMASMLEDALTMDDPAFTSARAEMVARAETMCMLAHGLLGIPAHVDLISGDEGSEDMAVTVPPENGPRWYPSPDLVRRMTSTGTKLRTATASTGSTLLFYDAQDERRTWENVLNVGLSRTSAEAEVDDPNPVDLLRVVGEWRGICEPHAVVSNEEKE